MLRFFFLIAFSIISILSFAQVSLTGNVKDDTAKPLAGATIHITGTNKFAVTDDFGSFTISGLSPGEITLVVQFLGFEEKVEKIDLRQSTDISISLSEAATITDEVVIRATRANDKTATTFTSVGKQAIQKQNFGQDLPLLLNWTPSVVTTSDAGAGVGYTGIRIRGSDATRVNVTINGIPYNDSESLGTFWVDIPDIAASSQSIQIQRGVGTSSNGAGAFGATINLQTNIRNDKPYAQVTNSFGSFNTRKHAASFGTGLLNDHWVVDGRVSKIVSDGFIDRASSDLQSYYLSSGYYAQNTIIKAIMFGGKERTYQSWYGVPESRLNNDIEAMTITAINEGWNDEQTANLFNSNSRTFNPYTYKNQVDDYKQDHYQLHFSQQLNTSLTLNTSLHYTYGRGYYEEFKYDANLGDYGLSPVNIGDSIVTNTDLIRRRWLDNDFYGFTYSLNYSSNTVDFILGGGWNRYDGDHFGEIIWAEVSPVPTEHQYYFNNGDKRDFNTYAKATAQVNDRLSVFADLQLRRITYAAGGLENDQNTYTINVDYHFFNPKFGLTYALNSTSNVYTSFAIGNREPVRDDFIDNQGDYPEHETLRNLEVGYRRFSDKAWLNANGYLMDYKNQLVLTGKLNDVGAPVRTNVDNSSRLGVEIEGGVKLSDRLSWSANLTFSRNKINEFTEVLYDYGVNYDEFNVVERLYENTDISFSPSVISGSALSLKPFGNAEITWLAKYVGQQYLDNTSNESRRIDGYMVNDLRFSYNWKPNFLKEVNCSLLLNNILEAKYESNGYTWGYIAGGSEFRENYFYPQAGRNFMVMISIMF